MHLMYVPKLLRQANIPKLNINILTKPTRRRTRLRALTHRRKVINFLNPSPALDMLDYGLWRVLAQSAIVVVQLLVLFEEGLVFLF